MTLSVAAKCGVAPPSTKRKQIMVPTSFFGIHKFNNNNNDRISMLADFDYRGRNFRPNVHRKSSLASHRKVNVVEVEFQEGKCEEVVVIDGLEPALFILPEDLSRSDFPNDFFFGASTSAFQTEGSGSEGGRGPATWDFMLEADEGRKAVDSYNLYKEDVKLLKQMGMNSYRFSMAWPRILPQGSEENGPINQEGIDFYNKFIDELIANDITPVVTLFHFDLPVALQNQYNGFLNRRIIDDFKKFAEICFKNFGDRVKYWSTINEPFVWGSFGYKIGLSKDLQSNPLGTYIATHNIILAHAAAAKLYHLKYQKKQRGIIGICLSTKWYEPQSLHPLDVDSAKKQLDFMLGWYMDPFVYGDYPKSMKGSIKGLPEFTKEEKKMLKKANDYIGLNYYTARFARQESVVNAMDGYFYVKHIEETVDIEGNQIGWQAQGQPDIYVHPDGLRKLILYVKEKYKNPVMYVTENGVPAVPKISGSVKDLIRQGKTAELEAAFFDDYRIFHAQDHLTAVREAMMQGAQVKGYFVWTLMDNFEVGAGYDCRFGLNFVDYYDNHKRYPKKSAKWFASFLEDAPDTGNQEMP